MRYRGKRRGWGKWIAVAVSAAVLFFAADARNWLRNKDELRELAANSELGKIKFEAKVTEITSPRLRLKAYLLEDAENPIVSVSFIFKNAGYASDNAGEEGIANMTAALLTEGAGDYPGAALKDELESRGIRVAFGADKDDFTGSLLTTKENLPQAVRLMNLMLTQPRFEHDDIARVQKQMINALRRQNENPNQVLLLEFNKELYGSHPYARNPLGREKDILAVDKARLQKFGQDNLITANLITGIAGDIGEEEAGRLLDTMFAGLPQSGSLNFVRNADLNFDNRSRQISRDAGQNVMLRAVGGAGRTHEDFYPLYVANYILGGAGLTSRLSQKIREEKGLTYGVYSYLSLDDKAPLIVSGFSSTPDKYAEAEALLEQEWKAFAENGASQEELDKAKKYLTASNNLRFASIENISAMLAAMQKYNLGLDFLQKRNDYISQIDLDSVNRAAKKYFAAPAVSVRIGSF